MAKTLFLAFSNPADAAEEDQFNQWYTERHVPQLLEHIPGLVSAQRYQLDSDQLRHRYLTVYEVDGEPAAVLEALAEKGADGSVERSPLLQRDPPPIAVFVTPVGEKVVAHP